MVKILSKTKHKKYERVRQLPNVIFAAQGNEQPAKTYPWHDKKYQAMKHVLELGCGKGEHTLFFADRHPENLYVGIDLKSHRLCVGAEKAMEYGLKNAIFLHSRIETIKTVFYSHSIDQIWLTFPDPHLKNRKVKARLTGPEFLTVYENLLVPGGRVFLKTDSEVLYQYTQQMVSGWGGKILVKSKDIHSHEDDSPYAGEAVSAFETKARKQGVTIKFLAFSLN